jgi:MFS family permease
MESLAQTSKAIAENTIVECADPESGSDHHGTNHHQTFNGWMYKSLKVGPLRIPYFASPQIQLLLVTLVAVLCSAMMNTLTGLGGGGQGNAHDANNAQVAYNCTSAGLGFFVGSIINRLGIKTSLFLGSIGFPIYISSFLSYNHNHNAGYLIFAGGLAGFCGSMLWVTQGVIMTSYPPESSKGRFVSWFYLVYSSGGVIASLVSHAKSHAFLWY